TSYINSDAEITGFPTSDRRSPIRIPQAEPVTKHPLNRRNHPRTRTVELHEGPPPPGEVPA
ncbi:MAG: hypothetical protein ACRDT5_02655, partial [Mycobacterium sp.]